MKNLIILSILSVFSISLKSQEYQDYIIKQNGDTIKCKITGISEYYILFKYYDLNKGKVRTEIDLNDVKSYKSIYFPSQESNIIFNSKEKSLLLNDSTFNVLFKKVENINNNMLLSHNEFRKGTETIVSGLFCSIISSICFVLDPTITTGTSSYTNQTYINPVPIIGFSLGTIIMVIGEIIQIDSHKYF